MPKDQPKSKEKDAADPNKEKRRSADRGKERGRSHSRSRSRSRSLSSRRKKRERSLTPKPVRIHIGRLTRNVTKDHVQEIFSNYGTIKYVEFPTDRMHVPFGRGFAYIEYTNPEDAENAMKHMDGGQIDGQEITAAPILVQHNRMRGPMGVRRMSPPMRPQMGRWGRRSPMNRFRRRSPPPPMRRRNSRSRRRRRSSSTSPSSPARR